MFINFGQYSVHTLSKTISRSQQDDKHQDSMRLVLTSAHQLGVLVRATRMIMRCHSLVDIGTLVSNTADELSLSGWFRAVGDVAHHSIQFGAGVSREYSQQLDQHTEPDQKISLSDKFIVFKTPYLLLVIQLEFLPRSESEVLCDNLALFVDTLDFWLENYQRNAAQEKESHFAKAETVNRMNDIVVTMLRFSRHLVESHQTLCQELLSDLLIKLPCLSLEFDQEESMIQMITGANDEHGKLIELQIKHNEEMRSVMMAAVTLLLEDTHRKCDELTLNSKMGENGNDGITLF